jgi:hypothetical protein
MGSSKPSVPTFNPGPGTRGIRDFVAQAKFVPELTKMLQRVNLADAQLMESFAPGLMSAAKSYGRTAESLSFGLIPADVQQNLFRNAAFAGLNTGIGMDSSAGRNMMARDLGLTSLELQNQSRGFMDAAMKSSAFLSPNRMSAGLMSAEGFQRRRDEIAAINHQVAAQNAMR